MINEGIMLFSKKTHSDAFCMFVIHSSAPQARFFMISAVISIFFAPAARLNNPGAPAARQKISRLFWEIRPPRSNQCRKINEGITSSPKSMQEFRHSFIDNEGIVDYDRR